MSPALAIDIGGTKTLVALVEGAKVIDERRFPTARGGDATVWLDQIADAARDWRDFTHVGAAVSGVIADGLWSALNPRTLPAPQGFPLERELRRRFARPVACFNDAQAAAWGEYRFGAGEGHDLVFLTISTGIGGGAVIGGKLLVGRGGLGASVGLTRVGLRPDSSRIEDVAAGRWLAEAAKSLGHDVDARGVFEAATEGQSWAASLIGASADAVATLLLNLQLLFDPFSIVIGGGVGLAPGFKDALVTRLDRLPASQRPDLRLAALKDHSGVVGAADLALNAKD